MSAFRNNVELTVQKREKKMSHGQTWDKENVRALIEMYLDYYISQLRYKVYIELR